MGHIIAPILATDLFAITITTGISVLIGITSAAALKHLDRVKILWCSFVVMRRRSFAAVRWSPFQSGSRQSAIRGRLSNKAGIVDLRILPQFPC
jgi:hypothetical protein